MPEKLLTLRELAEYLHITEEKIEILVDEGVISAYRIGGELLRFRKDQIEAIRAEIEVRITEEDKTASTRVREKVGLHVSHKDERIRSTIGDRIADFFHFNDFYLISAVLIAALIFVIFQG